MAYQLKVKTHLEQNVESLDQLNRALQLLDEVRDMENVMDDVYFPIETLYSNLRYTYTFTV